MNYTFKITGSLAALALCAATAHAIPNPILEYKFEDSGTTSANTGSLGSTGDVTFYNAVGITSGSRVGTAANLHSASGTGVGGVGKAFDNTASVLMGGATANPTGGNGNRVQTTSSTVSVTHHTTSDPEVFTFAVLGAYLELEWDGTDWVTIVNHGVTI